MRIVERSRELRQLLETLFIAELVQPGRELYLHLPVFTDCPLLDNERNQFRGIFPDEGFRTLSVADLLVHLMLSPLRVHVATTVSVETERLFDRLQDMCTSTPISGTILLLNDEGIDPCGILGDDYCLYGHVALQREGPQAQGVLEFSTAPEYLVRRQGEFKAIWNGATDVRQFPS